MWILASFFWNTVNMSSWMSAKCICCVYTLQAIQNSVCLSRVLPEWNVHYEHAINHWNWLRRRCASANGSYGTVFIYVESFIKYTAAQLWWMIWSIRIPVCRACALPLSTVNNTAIWRITIFIACSLIGVPYTYGIHFSRVWIMHGMFSTFQTSNTKATKWCRQMSF